MSQIESGNEALNPLIAAMRRGHYLLFCQRIQPLDARIVEKRPFQEILIRYLQEEIGMLPPGSFFPALEEQGLMSLLDCWVVSQLLKLQQIGIDSAPGWPPPRNSINLSADSVRDPDFLKFVIGQVEKWRPSADTLCFEVIESVAFENSDELLELAAALAPRGCNFALGGFNGSVEGLELLSHLPVNFVKIDGNVVRNVASGRAERARVENINRYCKDQGMRTIAELVETEDVLQALREIGVDYAQGFGIALPAPFLAGDEPV
jgi:EAL domain-containing protein (putative c-di-GMP-specific phosphodiesterase class I)